MPSCVLVAGISTAIGQDFPQYSKMRLKYPNNDQEAHRDIYLDFVTLNPSHTSRFLKQFSRTGSTDPTKYFLGIFFLRRIKQISRQGFLQRYINEGSKKDRTRRKVDIATIAIMCLGCIHYCFLWTRFPTVL